jgi:hypothetical protein
MAWSELGVPLSLGISLVAVAVAWGRRGALQEVMKQQQAHFEAAMEKAIDQQRAEFRESISGIEERHAAFIASTGGQITTLGNSVNLLSAALTGFGGPGTGALAKLDKVSRRVHRLSTLVTALLVQGGMKIDEEIEEED